MPTVIQSNKTTYSSKEVKSFVKCGGDVLFHDILKCVFRGNWNHHSPVYVKSGIAECCCIWRLRSQWLDLPRAGFGD